MADDTSKLLREKMALLADTALAELERRGVSFQGKDPSQWRKKLRENAPSLPPLNDERKNPPDPNA